MYCMYLFVYFVLLLFTEQLGITSPDYYHYLNQSGAFTVDGMDDVKEYRDTMVTNAKLHLLNPNNSSFRPL